MGGSKVRALLGGVVVVSILAFIASEVGADPAGATRQRSTKTELARPHGVRPAAAQQRRTILQTTPLALAAELAAQQVRSTQERREAVIRYVQAEQANLQAAWFAGVAQAEAEAARVQVEARQAGRPSAPRTASGVPAPASTGDYSATMACIRAHESNSAGGYSAVNASSGAGGAYQALPSTWAGYAGYARAQDAPAAVQDQWAREAISKAGTRPWAGSGC